MTDYVATQKITGGPYDGMPLSTVHPTIVDFAEYNFTWTLPDDFGTFASRGIIGFKVVGEFDGTGSLTWDWSVDNPGYPTAPEWPSGTTDGDHIGWYNSYDPSAYINVSGPTVYEWTFALTDTASDPTYHGYAISDPLGDLEVSLHATVATHGFDYTIGTIGGVDVGTAVEILRWDLVLFTASTSTVVIGSDLLAATPVTRLWPRDDNLGLGTASRIHPPPRANRIVGGQP